MAKKKDLPARLSEQLTEFVDSLPAEYEDMLIAREKLFSLKGFVAEAIKRLEDRVVEQMGDVQIMETASFKLRWAPKTKEIWDIDKLKDAFKDLPASVILDLVYNPKPKVTLLRQLNERKVIPGNAIIATCRIVQELEEKVLRAELKGMKR